MQLCATISTLLVMCYVLCAMVDNTQLMYYVLCTSDRHQKPMCYDLCVVCITHKLCDMHDQAKKNCVFFKSWAHFLYIVNLSIMNELMQLGTTRYKITKS